jgi:hypothetical protein
MQSFNSLSDDILIGIFEIVGISNTEDAPRSTKDLVSLVNCSRRFQQLAESVLYRKFSPVAAEGLPEFISTLLVRPNLTKLVREIKVLFSNWLLREPIGLPHEFGGFTLVEKTQIRTVLKTYSFPPELVTSWVQDMADGMCHALASFILLICSNVIEFRISSCSDLDSSLGYITAILKIAAESRQLPVASDFSSLQRLTTLGINYGRRRNCPGLKTIFSLLTQHPFTSFEGSNVQDGTWWNIPLATQLQIVSLRLDKSNLSSASLTNFLRGCSRLKTLYYKDDRKPTGSHFLPQEFGRAIDHLKPSLETLTLYRGSNCFLLPNIAGEFATIGSLAGFQKLKTLSISTDLLLGPQNTEDPTWHSIRGASKFAPSCCGSQLLAHCLPQSLEELLLHYCVDDIFGKLLVIVHHKDTVTPNLKSIYLVFPSFVRTKKGGKKHRNPVTGDLMDPTTVSMRRM